MPTAYINTLHKKGYGSIKTLEKKWAKAKHIAKSRNYAVITAVFKNLVGIKENRMSSFRDFLTEANFTISVARQGDEYWLGMKDKTTTHQDSNGITQILRDLDAYYNGTDADGIVSYLNDPANTNQDDMSSIQIKIDPVRFRKADLLFESEFKILTTNSTLVSLLRSAKDTLNEIYDDLTDRGKTEFTDKEINQIILDLETIKKQT